MRTGLTRLPAHEIDSCTEWERSFAFQRSQGGRGVKRGGRGSITQCLWLCTAPGVPPGSVAGEVKPCPECDFVQVADFLLSWSELITNFQTSLFSPESWCFWQDPVLVF